MKKKKNAKEKRTDCNTRMNDNIELLKLYKNKYETDNEYIVEPKNWESLGLGGDNGFNALDFFYFSCIYKNNIGTELLFESLILMKNSFFIYITLRKMV